ncbi:hypothetical protein L596_022672 [Steinernema carpocapsae]|uniref:Enoyl-CoA hydratase n=1 Tax=Steinernema carpocapsae TaxID=34508 RepID=A0A4U5MMF5_STECR|nr:hypothetical protein L596_022672 [Steinernema carpocapsae]
MSDFTTMELHVDSRIAQIVLNRPDDRNTLTFAMLSELKKAFEQVSEDSRVHVVVLIAAGKDFSSGIDLKAQEEIFAIVKKNVETTRRGRLVREKIVLIQKAIEAVVKCPKPIIAAIQGECIGRSIDLIAACDIRIAVADATFAFRTGRLGQSFLVNPLIYLPKVVRNQSWIKEMTYTGSRCDADMAFQNDLISRVCKNREEMMVAVTSIAKSIAAKSPIAVQANKKLMNYARDHDLEDTVATGLNFQQMLILGQDLQTAIAAHRDKKKPEFKSGRS